MYDGPSVRRRSPVSKCLVERRARRTEGPSYVPAPTPPRSHHAPSEPTATALSAIFFNNLTFGACAYAHMYSGGGLIHCAGGVYNISGSAGYAHWYCGSKGKIFCASNVIGISGTPAFGIAFAYADTASAITGHANTFPGTGATGIRYSSNSGSVIYVANAGPNYLPGNAAGQLTTGGIYA